MSDKKHKHLTLDDRSEIEVCLKKEMSFKAIGKLIEKDPTTVSKEVKRNSTHYADGNEANGICPKLQKSPFCCNSCKKRSGNSCGYNRVVYLAKQAHQKYELLLVESREGIPLTKEQFYKDDAIIAQGVKKGQHIYHIIKTNELSCSQSSVYRYINKGYSAVSRIELPRAVKFKPRKLTPKEFIPKSLKVGRTYADFLIFKEEQEIVSWVEMDTVIGNIGGKVLLTFQFVAQKFMIGFLLENKEAIHVAAVFTELRLKFTNAGICFKNVFNPILTDNGGEFSCVTSIENNALAQREINLFFCDPRQSQQKAHVENNHAILRNILPKGTSFDELTQDKVNLIFSHINSTTRSVLNGKTPIEMFDFAYSEQIRTLLGITKIEPNNVCQNKKLLAQ